MGERTDVDPTDIAIVGMAGRFPGARDVKEFWANVRDGVESIRTLDEGQLEDAGVPDSLREDPDHVPREGVLDDVERFDADFFGLSPRDAAIMDPQHRHFLECAWEALETAGHPPSGFDGRVGVYAGSGMHAYLIHNLLSNPSLLEANGMFLIRHTGNDKDFLATRASYELDLHGPSVNVQTACSTSLVAVHMACESLLAGESDMALAGGATLNVPQGRGYLHREGGILSAEGRCRAFDAGADGTVFGSGVGVVVLRRLEDALADGDPVHAVIKGSAVNNDGAEKAGFLAPSVDGQAKAIAEALALSEVDPETIDYVECHGTGTRVGDPIEVEALTRAFRARTDARGFCALGSVKTNVGHLDTAAGVAGLIKAVQALEHGKIPPSLHYEEPNPKIGFDSSPFYVNDTLREWETDGTPRRAGVSALGVGGTNAHVVLEEAPERTSGARTRSHQLLPLSAKTPEALERATDRLASRLEVEADPELDLADVAYTLQAGRERFPCRRTVICRRSEEAAEVLRRRRRDRVHSRIDRESRRSVAFLFPGQGAQYPGMGAGLYETEPPFRKTVDRCAEILEPELGFDLRDALFSARDDGAARDRLRQTAVTQPAVFTVEYALAQRWRSLGVEPSALIGHSLGEYVAACLADVFSLEDALTLVAARGRLMQELPRGTMLAVPLPEDRLRDELAGTVSVAGVNAPGLCVVSGEDVDVERARRRLGDEVPCKRLQTSHAFHSAMMDPMLEGFEAEVRALDAGPPSMPIVSNVTGDWLTADQATDPAFWARHVRETVRFADGIGTILEETDAALLEVGPGDTLVSLSRRHPEMDEERPAHPSLPRPDADEPDVERFLLAAGGLWRAGVEIDWDALHSGGRRRVSLPTYPFEHERHWIEPGEAPASTLPTASGDDGLRKRADVGEWLYRPTWRGVPLGSAADGDDGSGARTLVLGGSTPLGEGLADRLAGRGHDVVRAFAGEEFSREPDGVFHLDPADPDHFRSLARALAEDGGLPDRVVHGWSASPGEAGEGRAAGTKTSGHDEGAEAPLSWEDLSARLDGSFFSLLHLARALGDVDRGGGVEITVLSDGAHAPAGEPPRDPLAATLLGPVRVIEREFSGLSCRNVDVRLPPAGSWRRDRLLGRLADEITASCEDRVVAYRGSERMVPTFERARDVPDADGESRLRDGGVYLITGGLGGVGRALAEHLAATRGAKLVLTGRSGLPPRDRWDERVAEGPDRTSRTIRAVRRMEEKGAEVRVARADATDRSAMRRVVEETREAFGTLHGVFHLAGTLDDGLIRLKSRESAERVLRPKVQGALVLDAVLGDEVEDFVLYFSSISALAGPIGQVDYAAANAFLDAHARRASATGRTPHVAVDWGTWKEVGMAARPDGADPDGPGADGAADGGHDGERPHPLLDRVTAGGEGEAAFAVRLDPDRHWVLDEHRLREDTALLPGTAYLELARAAAGAVDEDASVALVNVVFSAPWVPPKGRDGELRLTLSGNGGGRHPASEFTIRSRGGALSPTRDGDGLEHARGAIRVGPSAAPEPGSPHEIRERCDEGPIQDGLNEQFRFGPRWDNVESIHVGDGEALVELALPEDFRSDLEDYPLHPALLDSALGAGQSLVPGYRPEDGFFFPVSVDEMRMHRPLSASLYSHVRLREVDEADDGEQAVFDVTLHDESGSVLVEVEGYRMKRASDAAALESAVATRRATDDRTPPTSGGDRGIFDLARREGITTGEGMEALERILSGPLLPGVVVSPLELDAFLRKVRHSNASDATGPDPASSSEVRQDRPSDVSTPYREPRTELERRIADVWKDFLGIEDVGVDDDFFELGGHSLLLSRIASRLQQELERSVPLSRLFDESTISGWAELAEEEGNAGGETSMEPVSSVPRDEYAVEPS